MPAGIGNLEAVVLRQFFACLNLQRHAVAIGIELTDGALVQCELGINEVPMILGQPLSSVESSRGFLATGQSQLDRSSWREALLLETDERIHPHRCLGFVIG